MSDYEAEIMKLRSEMEFLEIKVTEDELQNYQKNPSNFADQKMAKEVVFRLTNEEYKLRNDFQLGAAKSSSSQSDEQITKEKMLLMQQKKIASLDLANMRLLEELKK